MVSYLDIALRGRMCRDFTMDSGYNAGYFNDADPLTLVSQNLGLFIVIRLLWYTFFLISPPHTYRS